MPQSQYMTEPMTEKVYSLLAEAAKDWAGYDFTYNDRDIARAVGVTEATARNWRQRVHDPEGSRLYIKWHNGRRVIQLVSDYHRKRQAEMDRKLALLEKENDRNQEYARFLGLAT